MAKFPFYSSFKQMVFIVTTHKMAKIWHDTNRMNIMSPFIFLHFNAAEYIIVNYKRIFYNVSVYLKDKCLLNVKMSIF